MIDRAGHTSTEELLKVLKRKVRELRDQDLLPPIYTIPELTAVPTQHNHSGLGKQEGLLMAK